MALVVAEPESSVPAPFMVFQERASPAAAQGQQKRRGEQLDGVAESVVAQSWYCFVLHCFAGGRSQIVLVLLGLKLCSFALWSL